MGQMTVSDVDDMDEIISSTSSQQQPHKKIGKHIEPRKIRKPLMEKKRRARINQSLDELKRIIVDAEKLAGQDLSRVNKLEKADILEMTVRYLKRNKSTPTASPPQLLPPPPSRPDVYMAGFRQCVDQVQELLSEQWSDERRQQSGRRMVEHLEACVQQLNVPATPNRRLSSSFSSSDESNCPATRHSTTSTSTSSTSEDDDGLEEEQVAANQPSHDDRTTTEFQGASPKSMWRPW